MEPDRGYVLVFETDLAAVAKASCTATHTPVSDGPPGCAHTSVFYPVDANKGARKAARYRLAHEMSLVAGTVSQRPPPGA